MNLRKITSMTMFVSLIVLLINSFVLYVVPEGRVAYWSNWNFLGLSKTHWGEQHTTVGFLFLAAGLLHIYYNWRVVVAYMKNKTREIKIFTGSFNVALVLTVIFIVGTYFQVPPMSTIISISDSFKKSASEKYGEPPYGHAESSSLKMFAKKVSLDLAKSIELLKAADITISSDTETIKSIALKSKTSPQQIYMIIKSAVTTESAVSEKITGYSSFPASPKPGWGKMTISEICDDYNLNPEKLLHKLTENGITVDLTDTVKEVAAANDIEPMAVFEAIHEIVTMPREIPGGAAL